MKRPRSKQSQNSGDESGNDGKKGKTGKKQSKKQCQSTLEGYVSQKPTHGERMSSLSEIEIVNNEVFNETTRSDLRGQERQEVVEKKHPEVGKANKQAKEKASYDGNSIEKDIVDSKEKDNFDKASIREKAGSETDGSETGCSEDSDDSGEDENEDEDEEAQYETGDESNQIGDDIGDDSIPQKVQSHKSTVRSSSAVNKDKVTDEWDAITPATQHSIRAADSSVDSSVKEATSKIFEQLDCQSQMLCKILEIQEDMRRSMANQGASIKSLEERVTALEVSKEHSLGRSPAEVREHSDIIQNLEEQVNNLERKQRERNLRLVGLRESLGEDCKQIIEDILRNELNMNARVEVAHRTGRKNEDMPRHMIFRVDSIQDKIDILKRQKSALQKYGFFIVEDLTRKDYKKKQAFSSQIASAKRRGQRWQFKRGRLYIDGEEVFLSDEQARNPGMRFNARNKSTQEEEILKDSDVEEKSSISAAPGPYYTRDSHEREFLQRPTQLPPSSPPRTLPKQQRLHGHDSRTWTKSQRNHHSSRTTRIQDTPRRARQPVTTPPRFQQNSAPHHVSTKTQHDKSGQPEQITIQAEVYDPPTGTAYHQPMECNDTSQRQ